MTAPYLVERCEDLLARLDAADPRVVELGVFRGLMSEQLLRRHPTLRLWMVDAWQGHAQPGHTRSQGELVAEAMRRTAFAEGRRTILRATSTDAAAQVPDGSFDLVFIDADHAYEAVVEDIELWLPKVRPGGVLGGHDYDDRWTKARGYGVVQAVDEAAERHGWDMELGPDTTWYVRLP